MATLIWKAPMHYYSMRDEAFFAWLQSIPGVTSVRGIGRELHVKMRSRRVSGESLLELMAIYRRYGGYMSELSMFARDSNASWFRDPTAPWYKKVFPELKTPRSNRV